MGMTEISLVAKSRRLGLDLDWNIAGHQFVDCIITKVTSPDRSKNS